MLAPGWDFSWDHQPEHLDVSSPGTLGFLTTALLGSQGESPRERESQVDLVLDVIQCHFCFTLFDEAITKSPKVLKGRKIDSTS